MMRLLLASTLTYGSALVVSLALIYTIAFSNGVKLNEKALGKETVTVPGYVNGDLVHCYDYTDINKCIATFKNRKLKHSSLWLGNSQLHAINQPSNHAIPASAILSSELRMRGLDLITVSQPNANLAEHLIIFDYLKDVMQLDLLVLPVFFDDTRETGIRSTLHDFVKSNEQIDELNTKYNLRLNNDLYQELSEQSLSLQQKTENLITSLLDTCCSWSQIQQKMQGEIKLGIHKLRNTIFRIKADTPRRKIPALFQDNLNSLNAILSIAEEHKIQVLVYIPPIRSDIEIPYNPTEYIEFKSLVFELGKRNQAHFYNFEDIVPGPLWGLKDSTLIGGEAEIDFMHFNENAHKILADTLLTKIEEIMNDI
ncbi:hypothetical protein OAV66_00385 [Planktomarina temperata]|nr:hypothetical protein [Planktomarina temperata]